MTDAVIEADILPDFEPVKIKERQAYRRSSKPALRFFNIGWPVADGRTGCSILK